MDIRTQVENLRSEYGVSIPNESFTSEYLELLTEFKRQQIKDNWKDSLLFWALCNISRYNKYKS